MEQLLGLFVGYQTQQFSKTCVSLLCDVQVAAACLYCGNAPQALQHLELWAAELTCAARWPSQNIIDQSSAAHPQSHGSDVEMHDRDGHALRSLRMEDEEALLWAALRVLGDADCAAGLATTPKVLSVRTRMQLACSASSVVHN